MPIIDNLNSIIAAANNTTGAADRDVSAAVKTLIAGYGKGGSDYPPFKEVTIEPYSPASSADSFVPLPDTDAGGYIIIMTEPNGVLGDVGSHAYDNEAFLVAVFPLQLYSDPALHGNAQGLTVYRRDSNRTANRLFPAGFSGGSKNISPQFFTNEHKYLKITFTR